eukprot:gene18172-21347_t
MEEQLVDAVNCLFLAIKEERNDIVRAVLENAGKDTPDSSGGFTKELLSASAPPEYELTARSTALHYACKIDKPDMARTLLSSGASPSIKDADGRSPITVAVAGSPQLTTAFVTCLLQSVSMSDVEAIKAMVAGGIDLNTTDGGRQGNSALHWAASFATAEVVKLLCSNGADVNMQNTDGATPLHDAASRGDLGVLTAFIECGADATIKGAARSVKDKLPLDVVTDKGPNITEETAAAARVVLMKAQLAQPVGPASAAVDANSA